MDPIAYFPGFVATVTPMVLLLLLPVLPVRQAIRVAKGKQVESINSALQRLGAEQTMDARMRAPGSLAPVNELLHFRREIQAVPEWPFDVSLAGRMAFYLIIPPLTWVGAALIERFVDAFL
jgi:hypothetical protein